MHLLAGFLLFVLGFAMLVAGVALLVGGDIAFKSGKKVPKRVARKAAAAFLLFFPLVFAARFALLQFDTESAVPAAAVNWPLGILCLGTGLVILARGTQRTPRRVAPVQSTPSFDTPPADEAASTAFLEFDGHAAASVPPPPGNRTKPGRASQGPFDFT
jgi:hypothetical protein